MSKSKKKTGACTIEGVAKNYANELDAQFRTLNNFVSHSGEIGRTHEYYLRGVLSRFLPDNLEIGSGFIASPNWTSRQQDIIIYYKHDFTTLFKIGDCVVIDYNALVGTVEVKTDIDSSAKLAEALERISEIEGRYRNHGLRALYAWNGLEIDKALEVLWQFIQKDPTNYSSKLPHLIYVRGKYLLITNEGEDERSSPFSLWRISKECLTEGQALLGLVHAVWRFGLRSKLPPWWLLSWHDYYGHVPAKAEQIQWPSDLVPSGP